MKKGKWLVPFVIIASFCLILGILTKPIVEIRNRGRKQSKENAIQEEQKKAYKEEAVWEKNTSKIVDIQTGGNYTAILKEDGSVWIAGQNQTYTNNYIYEGIQRNEWTKMKLEDVKQIAVGDNFALALTKVGEVYSWGSNQYSQLGRQTSSTIPTQIPEKIDIKNIEKIYTFEEQAAALSYDGIAYYWGYAAGSDDGKKVKEIEKVKEIYLVHQQYYFKTQDNEIYAVGYDFDGIATSGRNGTVEEPIKINISNVNKIVTYQGYEADNGSNRIYVIKEEGTVWLLDTKGITLETPIEGLNNVIEVYPCQRTKEEKVSFLALDEQGNLHRYQNNFIRKDLVKNVQDVQIVEDTIIILKQDKTLWNLGRSIEFMLAGVSGVVTNYQEPMQIGVNDIEKFSLNSNQLLAVDSKNQLYRHGRNEKGQLGAGEKQNCYDLKLIQNGITLTKEKEMLEEEFVIDPNMSTMAD